MQKNGGKNEDLTYYLIRNHVISDAKGRFFKETT